MSELQSGLLPEMLADVDRLQARIWRAARDGVMARPEFTVAVLTPVNETLDLHAMRIGASRKHIPGLVMAQLVTCSLLSIALIGYVCGMDDRRRLALSLSLTMLVASALWTTIDLDHPRAGVLRLDDAPLRELRFDPH